MPPGARCGPCPAWARWPVPGAGLGVPRLDSPMVSKRAGARCKMNRTRLQVRVHVLATIQHTACACGRGRALHAKKKPRRRRPAWYSIVIIIGTSTAAGGGVGTLHSTLQLLSLQGPNCDRAPSESSDGRRRILSCPPSRITASNPLGRPHDAAGPDIVNPAAGRAAANSVTGRQAQIAIRPPIEVSNGRRGFPSGLPITITVANPVEQPHADTSSDIVNPTAVGAAAGS